MTKSEISMENHQSTEQKSSQSSDSELAESKERWKSAIPLKLILHNPWLIWIAVGAFLFTVISISLFSITNISYVKDETTPAGNANPTASPTSSAIALLLPGAVVLGCAVGAIAIAKRRQISSQFQFTSTAIARRSNHQPKAGEIAEIVAAPVQHGQLAVRSSTAHPCPPLAENQPQESPVNLIEENQQLKDQEEAGGKRGFLRGLGGRGAEGKEDRPQEVNACKGEETSRSEACLEATSSAPSSCSPEVTSGEASERQLLGAEHCVDFGVGHEPTRLQEKMSPIRGEACTENPLAPLPKSPPAQEPSCQTLSLTQELEPEDSALRTAAVGTESLVEMLDIRKKLPLSAILGNYQQREP